VYRLNFPGVPLNVEDIRAVSPEQVLEEAGLERGEADVMEGSPPCASFSTAGKREKHWGDVVAYSDTEQRVDDLFWEFARVLRGVQPKTFVAENVSGLVKGKAKGYFKEILAELKGCGYRVRAKVLDAQWLGVPQMRQRVIFVGVREDLGLDPVHPKPLPHRYSVREAIPWIVEVKHSGRPENWQSSNRPAPTIVQSGALVSETGYMSGQYVRAVHDTSGAWSQGDVTDRPCPAGTVGPGGMNSCHYRIEGDDVRVDPDTEEQISIEGKTIGEEWDKLSVGEASDKYFNLRRVALDGPSSTVTQMGGNIGMASVTHPTEKRKFTILELKRICSFPDDFQLTGTYAQRWERLGRAVPPLMMKAIALEVERLLEAVES
jgi:DNA (cytosine-5)-methyltransferase 1